MKSGVGLGVHRDHLTLRIMERPPGGSGFELVFPQSCQSALSACSVGWLDSPGFRSAFCAVLFLSHTHALPPSLPPTQCLPLSPAHPSQCSPFTAPTQTGRFCGTASLHTKAYCTMPFGLAGLLSEQTYCVSVCPPSMLFCIDYNPHFMDT